MPLLTLQRTTSEIDAGCYLPVMKIVRLWSLCSCEKYRPNNRDRFRDNLSDPPLLERTLDLAKVDK